MIEFVNATDRFSWDDVISKFEEASLQQSWQWGDVNTVLSHQIERLVVKRADNAVGVMQCIVKDARRGRYLEVPGGPLIDWSDESLVTATINRLRELAKQHNCVFIRIRPQLEDDPLYTQQLANLGGRPALMHISADHTSIVDLTLSIDDLMTAMRQQTRYEVRRSTKRDIVVSRDSSKTIVDTFHELQVDTARRQGFIPPSRRYLEACMSSFSEDALLYSATKHGKLLNLALVLQYGSEAAYFEAASTAQARKEPGAYAVVWQAMLDAKSAGRTRFNLWGTAPPDSPNHRYAGVTTFKRGFGGRDVAYVQAHDFVLQPLHYRITRTIEAVRKKRRKL